MRKQTIEDMTSGLRGSEGRIQDFWKGGSSVGVVLLILSQILDKNNMVVRL